MRVSKSAALLSCLAFPAVGWANVLLQIDPTSGGSYVSAFALSDDGSTVVGSYRTATSGGTARAFEWSPGDSTVVDLGSLPTNQKALAYGVNANGTIITGSSGTSAGSGSNYDAFNDTNGTLSNFGNVSGTSGGALTLYTRVSQDGSTFIATNNTGDQGYIKSSGSSAWTSIANLATVPAGVKNETADGISANGGVITGRFVTSSAPGTVTEETYRYTTAGGFQVIDTASVFATGSTSFPVGEPNTLTPVSGDGNWVTSTATFTNSDNSTQIDAYLYNAADAQTIRLDSPASLASVAGFTPTAVTDDGSFVVGRDGNAGGASGGGGWIWSEGTGFESITQFLTNNGLDPSSVGGTGDVYGVALNGNVLTLTGLDYTNSTSSVTSYFAQVTVPEPASTSCVLLAGGMFLRRRRR